jgi:hypothetical protein
VKPGRKQAKNRMSGAAVMLLVIEFWTGAGCLAILLFFACFLPGLLFSRPNNASFLRVKPGRKQAKNSRIARQPAPVQNPVKTTRYLVG